MGTLVGDHPMGRCWEHPGKVCALCGDPSPSPSARPGSRRATRSRQACRAARSRCRTSGDCTHEGHPCVQGHCRIASRVARSHRSASRAPALGDAGAARVPVVDEDRREPGVRVHRRRDTTDVPAITRGDQRQQADRGVLGGVDRARHVARSYAGTVQDGSGDRPPDGLGLELDRRQRQAGPRR